MNEISWPPLRGGRAAKQTGGVSRRRSDTPSDPAVAGPPPPQGEGDREAVVGVSHQ